MKALDLAGNVAVMLLILLYAAFVFVQVNGQATDHGHAFPRW